MREEEGERTVTRRTPKKHRHNRLPLKQEAEGSTGHASHRSWRKSAVSMDRLDQAKGLGRLDEVWLGPKKSNKSRQGRVDFFLSHVLKVTSWLPVRRLSAEMSPTEVSRSSAPRLCWSFLSEILEVERRRPDSCATLLLPNDPWQIYFSLKPNREIPVLWYLECLSRLRLPRRCKSLPEAVNFGEIWDHGCVEDLFLGGMRAAISKQPCSNWSCWPCQRCAYIFSVD